MASVTDAPPGPSALAACAETVCGAATLDEAYRRGEVRAHVPAALLDADRSLAEIVAEQFPASDAALRAASNGLFFSLPVAFDPAESVGPYLATLDRDATGEPYR